MPIYPFAVLSGSEHFVIGLSGVCHKQEEERQTEGLRQRSAEMKELEEQDDQPLVWKHPKVEDHHRVHRTGTLFFP